MKTGTQLKFIFGSHRTKTHIHEHIHLNTENIGMRCYLALKLKENDEEI